MVLILSWSCVCVWILFRMLWLFTYQFYSRPHTEMLTEPAVLLVISLGRYFSLFLWLAEVSQNFHPRNFPSTKFSIHTAVLSKFRPVTFAMAIFHYLRPNNSAFDPRVPFLKLPLVWWLKKVSREVKQVGSTTAKKEKVDSTSHSLWKRR